MQRSLMTLFLLMCIGFLPYCHTAEAALFSWGSETLLKIDNQEYTSDDFKDWWGNWREKDQSFPQTLDPYIDWLLFVKEAERMALFDDPTYNRDINTYHKVLSLVQLKNDEIDSRVIITDEMLREQYQKFYIPIWRYNIVVLKDKNTAETIYGDLVAKKISVDDLSRFADMNKPVPEGHPVSEKSQSTVDEKMKNYPGLDTQLLGVYPEVKRRPNKSNNTWSEILQSLTPSMYSKPFEWQEGYVIVQLLDKFEGDDDDFNKLKSGIQNKYRKNLQGQLTLDLIEKLKIKYGVIVNEERVKAIDPDSPDMIYTDAPLITINNTPISEKQVMEKVNKDIKDNQMYGFVGNTGKDVLLRVVNGIIGQTLITLESLDRHYENQSPIKELLEFKQNHRLAQKLEQQIRDQVSQISDEDISAYYAKHVEDEYTGPDIYTMALVKGSEEELNKIWLDVVVNGNDFMAAAEKLLGQRPIVQGYPATHLEKNIITNITPLNKGDVSRPFPLQEGFAIAYMVGFAPSEIAPLESVRENVRKKVYQERYSEVKDAYVKALREKTTIVINESGWIKLKAELIKAQ